MSVEALMTIAANLLAIGAAWGSLRAEVRALREDIGEAKAHAAQAHARLDAVLMKGAA